jgi:hypothetical protein
MSVNKKELEYEKFVKAVNVLKALHFKPENIMVTGSEALNLLGLLPSNRFIHDIDFVVKMDDQSWRCMKLIEAINNSNDNNLDYPGRKDTIFLNANGVVINIWKYTPDSDWSSVKDEGTGVMVATVDHIIKAKKTYGRPKDFQDIADICKNIL